MSFIDENGSLVDHYKNFIAISRYARWDDDLGRRETWTETVDRYINFMSNHILKNYPNAEIDQTFWKEAREAIVNHKVMPSMRALMTAGPALERSNVAGYNCFRGTERFLTSEGIKSFAEAVGTQQDVVGIKGDWVKADIRDFGVQALNDIRFSVSRRKDGCSRSAIKYDVQATSNHRWITENRGEVTDLRVGDVVRSAAPRFSGDIDPEAFIAGFGFGDGTIDNRGRAKVRLCGAKDAEFLEIFENYGNASFMSPPSYGGDTAIVFHKGHFVDWKQVPDISDKSPEWIASWLEGYLAADGHKKGEGFWELSSQSQAAIDFVKSVAPLAGYVVTGLYINSNLETNFGTRKAPLQRLLLSTEAYFRVESVGDSGLVEPVYCAVVPDGSAFALSSGMLTGNCSFIPLDSPRSFDEALYILMNGTGLGFSAEKKYVSKLPTIASNHAHDSSVVIEVADSKEGWARGLRELIDNLYNGRIPAIDITRLRPAGARLKTFGGRSSGPQPLVNLFDFVIETFKKAAGRQLTPLEAHDIMCKIGEVVVVGGVRRSALISLGDLDDYDMSKAKSGAWWVDNKQRALSNNSAVYNNKPSIGEFLQEWGNLYESKSGERGIVNMKNLQDATLSPRRDTSKIAGLNPCAEIKLRPYQFCNLTEVIIEENDTEETLIKKVKIATILGTIQSSLTNFKYLRKIWKDNCEEERLLGVSLTGQYGNKLTAGTSGYFELTSTLVNMRESAIDTNANLADSMGINRSTAITTVKPSGTVSQLTGTSSGMHPWHNDYYIRSVRQDNKDPLTNFMKDAGIPNEPDVMKPQDTTVFYFPQKSPEGAITRTQVSALEHLEFWKAYKVSWTEHNPSITVNVKEHEWIEVADWVYRNWDLVGGISFLPYSDHTYQQAPYQDIDKSDYNRFVSEMPDDIDWSLFSLYEKTDNTSGSQTLSCSSGSCELVGSASTQEEDEFENLSASEII